jgi:hypothetical protein
MKYGYGRRVLEDEVIGPRANNIPVASEERVRVSAYSVSRGSARDDP